MTRELDENLTRKLRDHDEDDERTRELSTLPKKARVILYYKLMRNIYSTEITGLSVVISGKLYENVTLIEYFHVDRDEQCSTVVLTQYSTGVVERANGPARTWIHGEKVLVKDWICGGYPVCRENYLTGFVTYFNRDLVRILPMRNDIQRTFDFMESGFYMRCKLK